MAQDCVFCKIIKRELPASIVYEDKDVIAFMSDRPVNEGHTLVIPKKHYQDIYDIPEAEAAYLFGKTKRIAGAVRDAFRFPGTRLVQNNGSAAGQVVFHLHIHIIPLKPRDDINNSGVFKNRTSPRSHAELEIDAEKIKSHLG